MEDKIGETTITNEGYKISILNYRNAKDIDIMYEDGYIIYNRTYLDFKRKSISKFGNFKDRTGEKRYNNQGNLMEVLNYRSTRDCDIMFEDGSTRNHVAYSYFKSGVLENLNNKTVYNIGYIGYGDYKPKNKETGKFIPQYTKWFSMMNRCYSEKQLKREPTYKGCYVCEEWHNFQNFAKWYDENYYELENETICLDKDILIKGNKIYSPETCIFVPHRINSLFMKKQKNDNLPVGVIKYHNKYKGCCQSVENKNSYIGLFSTPEEAFQKYKQTKESYIKRVADTYKSKYQNFPQKLYNAMYNYKVEITD